MPQPCGTSSNGPLGSTPSPGEAYVGGGGCSRCAVGERLRLPPSCNRREVIGLTHLLTCLLHPTCVAQIRAPGLGYVGAQAAQP